jgi:Holliday junction resolvase RusA-like endonuclease
MITVILFEILGIPVAKGRPRFFRRGAFVGTFTPGKTRAYENSVIGQAIQYKPVRPFDCPIEVSLRFFFPIPKSMPKKFRQAAEGEVFCMPKKPDIDNCIKSILDPLNTIFWEDDKQIVCVLAEKRYSARPRVEIAIKIPEEITQGATQKGGADGKEIGGGIGAGRGKTGRAL